MSTAVLAVLLMVTAVLADTEDADEICPRDLSRDKLLSLVVKCMNYAAIKHGRQTKDSKQKPYINHPIAVANILTEEGGVSDPVVILAAILHDTVEDTDATIGEIERKFGPEVSHVVAEVTDDISLSEVERKRLQIEHCPHISREAKLVKLADKIDNLRSRRRSRPVGWTGERVHEYCKVRQPDETLEVFEKTQ